MMRGRTGLVLRNTPVRWTSHANGMPHVRSTIRKMSELAKKGQASYPIRNLATRITRDVPSKHPTAELGALYRWVRDNIRYRYDPLGLEWLQSPQRTVLEGAGDCDDIATLLGALAGSLGHPYRFRTVGATPTVQQHVQVQAFDRKRWIDLDPVIEPTMGDTAPRTDPGAFAMQATGSDHLWDSEGNMLSGLSGPASRQDIELWSFAPYFTQVPPYGGGARPRFGIAARPDTRYRSIGAPGPWQAPRKTQGRKAYMIALRPGALSPGQLAGIEPYYHPTLGAGRIMKKIIKAGKKVASGVKKAVKVVGKIPGVKQLVKAAVSIVPGAGAALTAAKTAVQIGKGIAKGVKKGKAAKKAVGAAAKLAKGKAPAKGKGKAKVAAAKPGKKPTKAAPRSIPMKKAPAPVAVALAAKAASSPATAKAKQYPSNARMLWDRGAGVFRVFVPIAGAAVAISSDSAAAAASGDEGDDASEVAGMLGAFKPTFTISLLGELGATPANSKALAAISAVQAFTKKNKGKAPAVALPAVKNFQQVAGGSPALKPDGLWGSNTKAAAGYHAPGVALPATAPKLTGPVTWKPSAGAAGPAKTSPKKPPAGASFPAPPGYVEVGTEGTNPGLPPAGYTGPAAPPAPPVPGTPPQPSAPGGGASTPDGAITVGPVVPDLNPPSSPDWAPAGGGPGPIPVAQLPDVPTASEPTAVPAPGGAIIVAPGSPPPVMAPPGGNINTLPARPPSGGYATLPGGGVVQLPPPPLPAGPYPATPEGRTLWEQDQAWINSGAPYRGGASSSGKGDNTLMWAAIAYLYLRNRRAA